MKLHLPLSIAKYGKEEWCCFNYMYTSCKKESEINIFILGDYSHIKVFELKIKKWRKKTLKNLTTFIVAKHS